MIMTNEALSHDLTFAIDVCQQAGKVVLAHFKRGVAVSMKPDNTPVTLADRECEKLIRELIAEKFPMDGVLGEEEAPLAASEGSKRKWIIDPIDGTYNFARGIPIFSILLALSIRGRHFCISFLRRMRAALMLYWGLPGKR